MAEHTLPNLQSSQNMTEHTLSTKKLTNYMAEPPRPGWFSGRQSVSCHVPDQFPVSRGWQNVFRHCLGRFLIGRVCSAMSWFDFRTTECVPPCHGSICNNFCSIHCHILGRFPVGRVYSAMYWGNFVAL